MAIGSDPDGSERVFVVTGASGALGSALTLSLLSQGARVVGLGRHSERLAPELAAYAERCHSFEVDVSNQAEVARVLNEIEQRYRHIDGAALIAGGFAGGKPIHEHEDDSEWRAMLDANLNTAYASLGPLLARMVPRGAGSVVLVGSRAAVRPWESAKSAAYAAAKAGVVALAQAAAAEVLRHGVRVNVVLPSTLDTPANRSSMPNADFSRWVSLDSMTRVIEFLLSDAARDISGAVLPVYGRA